MLENTVRWRRGYRPDELDPEYIKPEVFFFSIFTYFKNVFNNDNIILG